MTRVQQKDFLLGAVLEGLKPVFWGGGGGKEGIFGGKEK